MQKSTILIRIKVMEQLMKMGQNLDKMSKIIVTVAVKEGKK